MQSQARVDHRCGKSNMSVDPGKVRFQEANSISSPETRLSEINETLKTARRLKGPAASGFQ